MSWIEEIKDGSKIIMAVLGIVAAMFLVFSYITVPIMCSLFTDTLTGFETEGEVAIAIVWWVIIFVFHCAAFLWSVGTIKEKASPFLEGLRNGLKRVTED